MNDNNEEKNNSNLSGFDSYHNSDHVDDENKSDPKEAENSSGFSENEYHYVKSDLVNDDDLSTDAPPQPEQPEKKQESSYTPNSQYGYFPSGTYGNINRQPKPVQPNFNHNSPKPLKPEKDKGGKNYSFKAVVASALIAAVIGASAGTGSFMIAQNYIGDGAPIGNSNSTSSDRSNEVIKNININTTVESVVQAVAEKSGPSVVGIRTTTPSMSFFGTAESTGEGSGVIYSEDGYIITNYHVVQQAAEQSGKSGTKIEVFLPSDQSKGITATIIGFNISADIAVIKINKTDLPKIEIGDSDKLNVGEYAIAIGNPGGLEFMGSVSYGIISGLNRKLETPGSIPLIQTDAAINPGNSGGALVNTKGQLIGINSIKLVAEGFEGMGFAIPVNTVIDIAKDIITHENEPEPYIGLEISTRYDASTLQMLGFPPGAVVQNVVTGSPADESGIKRGDIITEFAGNSINGYQSLNTAIQSCSPGSTQTVSIYRSGKTYTASITIGANSSQ